MENFVIVTDSCADLERELREKYEIEYIHNGFWLGGFKKAKIESIINGRVRKGWKYVGMTTHSSVFLILFRRTSLVLTFYRDF